ncbi:unnamed protein product [Fraxinus pennsylvanica]|uniref:Uncharacterized protein n=1 Tax=Fraxinus pennsylvanica TaxID=56036 RepID=A0AAD2DV69_9LAMI|nr:unnamed protein product [Fraxinus pennsylvanica]
MTGEKERGRRKSTEKAKKWREWAPIMRFVSNTTKQRFRPWIFYLRLGKRQRVAEAWRWRLRTADWPEDWGVAVSRLHAVRSLGLKNVVKCVKLVVCEKVKGRKGKEDSKSGNEVEWSSVEKRRHRRSTLRMESG